jgi:hypothetical protein
VSVHVLETHTISSLGTDVLGMILVVVMFSGG